MFTIILLASTYEIAQKWERLADARGVVGSHNFGNSIARIQDLDRDGIDEILIGDHGSYAGLPAGGAAHLAYGSDGVIFQTWYGPSSGSGFGMSVADAGDVDGDGHADLIIGSPGSETSTIGVGGAFVYSGRHAGLLHQVFGGAVPPGRFGESVAGVGDVNGDGHADFAVGDPDRRYVSGTEGVLWVYSGADAAPLYAIHPPGEVNVGQRCASVADLDGDACRDLLVTVGGAVLVVSGRSGTTLRRHPYVLPADGFGQSLTDAGDVNRDGVTDYAVGAPDLSLDRPGHVYLYSGATGAEIRSFDGPEPEAEFGWSVAGIGDADGDGYPDLLIGATNENRTVRYKHGAAHLRSGFDGSELAYFTSTDPAAEWIGVAVAGAGDSSGDGLDDFWIASWSTHATGRGVVRNYALQPWLTLAPPAVSASLGGRIRLDLDFPPGEGGRRYALLVSSGAGRFRVGDVWLPLDRTPLLERSAFAPPAAFQRQHGVLDARGDARAVLTLAPHAAAAWLGRTLKFCALTEDPSGGVSLYSAALPLRIEP